MEYKSGVVSPTDSISSGWQIIKNNYGTYVLMMLVFGIVLFISALIIGGIGGVINLAVLAAMGYSPTTTQGAEQISTAFLPQAIGLVFNFFTSIIITTISGVLICGIYKALSQTARTGTADFGVLFSSFDKTVDCLVVAVISSAIQIVIDFVMLAGYVAIGIAPLSFGSLIGADGKPNPELFGGMMVAIFAFAGLSVVIQLIIYALLLFVYPLVAERNISGASAVGLSIKGALGNIIGVLLLVILMFFMSLGGALLCLIGLLFVAPILFASTFAAYRSVFGSGDEGYNYSPPSPPTFGQQPNY